MKSEHNLEAQKTQNAKLQPLHTSNTKSVAPYPTGCLGKTLSNAARSIVRAIDIPEEMAANSVLGAASICAQSKINVRIKHLSFPASIFLITSACSGDRKSGAYNLAMKPIIEFEKNLNSEYASKSATTEDETERFRRGHILFDNATVEGIYKRFIESQPFQSISTPEGGAILGSHAMRESQIKMIISLSKLWAAEQIHWVTASGGTIDIPDTSRLSMHLMIQPELFKENLLNQKLFEEQGFLPRLLISEPSSKIGTRLKSIEDFLSFDIEKDPAYLKYVTTIKSLLKSGYSVHEEKLFLSRDIPLSDAAIRVWYDYYTEIELHSANDQKYAEITGIASKSAEQAVRIAGIISYIENGNKIEEISDHVMRDAVELARWYLDEMHRLFQNKNVSQDIKDARTWTGYNPSYTKTR